MCVYVQQRKAVVRLRPELAEKFAKKEAEVQLSKKSRYDRGGIEKSKGDADTKAFASSKAFFQTLQDEASR